MDSTIKKDKFYSRKEEMLTKKVKFYKTKEGKIFFGLEGEEVPEGLIEIGEIVYTLQNPSWWLKNYIRSLSSTANTFGVSSIDLYTLNNNIVAYLLKGWTIERKFEFDKDGNGVEKIKDVDILLKSELDDFVFDAIVFLYNRFIS
jgi:hypothetical protein